MYQEGGGSCVIACYRTKIPSPCVASFHLVEYTRSQSVTLLPDIKPHHPPSPGNQWQGFPDFLPFIPPDGHKPDFVMRQKLDCALFQGFVHTEFNIFVEMHPSGQHLLVI